MMRGAESGMVTRKSGAKPAAAPSSRRRGSASRVAVTEEQCRCLIEDVAMFQAARYRPAEPGSYRSDDWRKAEAEIRAVLKRRARRK
jgi:hypothetical protein